MNKDEVVNEVMRRMEEYEGKIHQACLYFAKTTCDVLHEQGIRASVQAGSAQWPRIRPDQDDGVCNTHFGYVFSDCEQTRQRFQACLLPEMHCWVALLQERVIIDLTTRFWPQQCLESQKMDWPGDQPPPYLWTDSGGKLPPRVLYRPEPLACIMALTLLRKQFLSRGGALRYAGGEL